MRIANDNDLNEKQLADLSDHLDDLIGGDESVRNDLTAFVWRKVKPVGEPSEQDIATIAQILIMASIDYVSEHQSLPEKLDEAFVKEMKTYITTNMGQSVSPNR
mgnify:CR=1 FL=1